ncbi:hypothetical protein GUJ93_ZPchr0004g38950 [Zizania palustris]|uniref:Uncharacterized protein n=1 Tax=Zizania palustris TaxID=103762 RepID=A0A8J5VDC9_ZIZPA|nr:hypothetical protein GUJ93_ZPchr0304g29169 [Zizania palustris]KAG8065330.1 hypothetical protein GUJ93_ZPchr0004g38950 [Zizania palustris]
MRMYRDASWACRLGASYFCPPSLASYYEPMIVRRGSALVSVGIGGCGGWDRRRRQWGLEAAIVRSSRPAEDGAIDVGVNVESRTDGSGGTSNME